MSEILSQRKLPQANVLLGFSNYYIHAKGCLVVELAECIGVSVEEVNDKLKNVGGFAPDASGQVSLVIWAKIAEAFPGVSVERFWAYNNEDVLAKLAEGKDVIVEVSAAPIGGTGSHFVRFIGNGLLHDPWSGLERPTSDFPDLKGYAVVSGKFVEPVAEPVAPAENSYQGLDLSNLDSIKAAIDAWKDVADGVYVRKDALCAALQVDASYSQEALVESIKVLKEGFATQAAAAANVPLAPEEPKVPSLSDAAQHEKDSLLDKLHAFEIEVKSLLGL